MIVYTLTEVELPKQVQEKIDSIESTLRDILKWTRFANITKLKDTLEKELEIDEKKLAYENSDGVNGIREVAVASGAPQDTVYGWWQKWFRLGLVVESEERKGRMMKIVSLDDVGIKIPKKQIKPSEKQESSEVQKPADQPSVPQDSQSENA